MRHGGKYEALFCILTRAVDVALLHGDGEPGRNNEEKGAGTLSGAFAKQGLEKSKATVRAWLGLLRCSTSAHVFDSGWEQFGE